jgi:branched-chain amino acid transport system substrate-binding protein
MPTGCGVALLRWHVVTRARHRFGLAVAVCLALVACSNGDEDVAPTSMPAPTTTLAPENDFGDGRLVIGALLPTSDPLLGTSLVEAVELGIQRINASGGVIGRPVRLVVSDEGSSTGTALTAIQNLVDAGVDAIVGPGSSTITLGTLDEIVSSGIVSCSPTASALALDDFPDDELFFRTIPSDSLQALAIAEVADQTGALQASIVHVDDAYGRGLAEAVDSSMAGGAISVAETIAFTGRDDDLSDEAQQLVDSNAPVAIVLAGGDDGTRFLEALDGVDTGGLATVLVNDAFRNPTNPERIANLDPQLRRKIVGLAPQAESSNPNEPFDPPGLFATNAYDCVNLIALAAVRADSDDAGAIAEEMSAVSSSGLACRTFDDCVNAIAADRQIDYNGPSGLTEVGANGETTRAVFDQFLFDADGEDVWDRSITVGF